MANEALKEEDPVNHDVVNLSPVCSCSKKDQMNLFLQEKGQGTNHFNDDLKRVQLYNGSHPGNHYRSIPQ